MTLRCIKCGRALTKFAATIPTRDGVVGWGPVCAQAVLVKPAPRQAQPRVAVRRAVVVDERQLELELG